MFLLFLLDVLNSGNKNIDLQSQINKNSYQEVMAWGWLSWSSCHDMGTFPQNCESIGELGVKQIVCAERWLLILTLLGKVYIMYYSSETQVV